MQIHKRLIDRGSLRETDAGLELAEVWRLTSMRGNEASRMHDALFSASIPLRGQPHDAIPGIVVKSRQADPVSGDNTKFDVRLTYGVPSTNDIDRTQEFSAASWRISARTAQVDTVKDIHGERMRVIYDGFPVLDYFLTNTATDITVESGVRYTVHRLHKARVERPLLFLEARRWERENPEAKLHAHHGSVNRDAWRGYPPKTVLLTDVGSSENAGGGYDVTYGFSVNNDTWREFAPIEIFGQIPQDAEVGAGLEYFDVYPSAPFSTLALV